jgi:hypothetical protein
VTCGSGCFHFSVTRHPTRSTRAFHLSWSAPLLLVVGVSAISRTPPTVRVTLVALAILAAAPAVYQRAGVLFEVDTESGLPGRTWLLPLLLGSSADALPLDQRRFDGAWVDAVHANSVGARLPCRSREALVRATVPGSSAGRRH